MHLPRAPWTGSAYVSAFSLCSDIWHTCCVFSVVRWRWITQSNIVVKFNNSRLIAPPASACSVPARFWQPPILLSSCPSLPLPAAAACSCPTTSAAPVQGRCALCTWSFNYKKADIWQHHTYIVMIYLQGPGNSTVSEEWAYLAASHQYCSRQVQTAQMWPMDIIRPCDMGMFRQALRTRKIKSNLVCSVITRYVPSALSWTLTSCNTWESPWGKIYIYICKVLSQTYSGAKTHR